LKKNKVLNFKNQTMSMTKKKIDKDERRIKINKYVSNLCITVYLTISLIGLVGMVFVAYTWGIQFHNFDLSYNMALWTNDINNADFCNQTFDFRNLRDRYGLGENETVRYGDIYITSGDLMSKLIFMAFASAGSFFYGMGGLLFWMNYYIERDAEKSLEVLRLNKLIKNDD